MSLVKVFILLFLLVRVLPAHSEDVLDLAAKYNDKKKDLAKLESDRRKILAEIYEIEKETGKVVQEKGVLVEKRVLVKSEMQNISRKIIEIERQIKVIAPEISKRTALSEKINQLPWMYTFLTSQSLIDLDMVFTSAERMNQLQAAQVFEFAKLINEMKQREKQLRETVKQLVSVKKSIEKKEKLIETNQKSQARKLKKIESHLAAEKRLLKTLKIKGKRAAIDQKLQELAILFGNEFFDKKGKLPSPVQAPIHLRFGLIDSLKNDGIKLLNKGLFYKTSARSTVKTVAEGRVKFIGKLNGMGQVVVIDHGGRYYSTYGNLAKATVKSGQLVEAGDKLGTTGFEHLLNSKGLYFEIRHFSQPQNPELWLKKKIGELATI